MDNQIKPKLLQRPRTREREEDGTFNSGIGGSGTGVGGGGSIQLLKRQPQLSNDSSQSQSSSRSNQASPVPGSGSVQTQESNSNGGTTNNKAVAPSAILERPKILTAGGLSTNNILDVLRPHASPEENAVPLIDSNLKFIPDSQSLKHLIEESRNTRDFFVVCAIGTPGSGKSTALSYLANPRKSTFMSSDKSDQIFLPRKSDNECTFYVAGNRTIYIEIAPVFSGTTAVKFVGLVQQFGTIEAVTITWNLRLVRWALSVSHLVLLFSDGAADPNLIQLISTAEMIHPIESAFGEAVYPEIVLVCNKVPMTSFLSETEDGYTPTHHKWEYLFRSLTGKIPRISPNVVLLPNNRCNFGFEEYRFEALKKIVDEWDRYNRAPFMSEYKDKPKIPQSITVSDWIQTCSKCWEEMSKQEFFASYLQSYLKFFP